MDAALLDIPRHFNAIVGFEASAESVAHIGLYQYGHVVSGSGHHFVQTHLHETHSVLERPSVFVLAVVGIGREELADQVTVSCVHLDDFVVPHAADEGRRIEVESC